MTGISNTHQSDLPFMQEHEIVAMSLCLRRFNRPVKALEWGSGRSTLYYATRLPLGSEWVAVEHDNFCYRQVEERIRQSGYTGIRTVNIPPEPSYRDWQDDEEFRCFSSYVLFPKKLASRFGFVLVDGRSRAECMALGWNLLEDDGVMVLHDAWREEYQSAIPADCFQIRISMPLDPQGYPAAILFMAKQRDLLVPLLRELRREMPAAVSITDNIGLLPAAPGRILFINTCYSGFLNQHYNRNTQLPEKPYYWQKRLLAEQCFGDSDFYSSAMISAGWDAADIVINCPELQTAWARENGLPGHDLNLIAIEQVRRFQPDVVYLQDLGLASTAFLDSLRPHTRLIAGQIASPLPPHAALNGLNIIFSSFPHFVQEFRNQGKTAWYQPLAFEPRLLQRLPEMERVYPATFVGGISPQHGKGLETLQKIAGLVPIDFWGYGSTEIPPESPIHRRHHGEAWGLDMFAILRQSAITLNRHIDVAGDYANNMRLFEATGCGALLITDYRYNLNELFEIGKEVVAYRSPEEAAALVRYYQANPQEAAAIARAGQERTLRDHTYTRRMEQTAEILERHLRYGSEQGSYPLPETVSSGYRSISGNEITESMTEGWKDKSIPAQQRGLVQLELEQMYAGQPKAHFAALADLIRPFVRDGSSVLELGCASGYYYEILEFLLGRRINYTGVDYSEAMIAMARAFYPRPEFFVADGKSLFFADRQFDLVISSCVLLHVPNYRQHIEETCRVAREWVVAHRTPACRKQPTRRMAKQAYGVETVEFCFNEQELLQCFAQQGFEPVTAKVISAVPEQDLYDISYLFRCRTIGAPC